MLLSLENMPEVSLRMMASSSRRRAVREADPLRRCVMRSLSKVARDCSLWRSLFISVVYLYKSGGYAKWIGKKGVF